MFYTPVRTNPPASTSGPAPKSADVVSLEFQVERLLMITEALWEILKEKHGYTNDELMKRVALIDLKDGKLDGKVARTGPTQCPKCQRVLNRRHLQCIYCGEQIVQDPFGR
ncbi:MAG TPA: hypothetical protein VEJ63_22730 [Planctomycetota bacterium]|nr:hypothetical protein [Planctomycetota bacterium]